jgi:hypothetical protein
MFGPDKLPQDSKHFRPRAAQATKPGSVIRAQQRDVFRAYGSRGSECATDVQEPKEQFGVIIPDSVVVRLLESPEEL